MENMNAIIFQEGCKINLPQHCQLKHLKNSDKSLKLKKKVEVYHVTNIKSKNEFPKDMMNIPKPL